MTSYKKDLFLKSALTEKNPFNTLDDVKAWLKRKNEESQVEIERIMFSKMKQWYFDRESGDIKHKSGKFFSIIGVDIHTNWGNINNWQQPIIDQQEIGILGIITKEIDGILYFLMQAKIEPGNINHVQLSPALQATKSNYSQAHKGKRPLYLDYFLNRENYEVLLDQLQSEQGARFLKKRNRNIIIKVEGDIPLHADFCWLTLGQIIELVHCNNTINMDTRTVISGISFDKMDITKFSGSYSFGAEMLSSMQSNHHNELHSFEEIISWLTKMKCFYELTVKVTPLKDVKNWIKTDWDIHHQDNKYFKVEMFNIKINSREVIEWEQPLIEPVQEGLCAFIIKKINGIYHFLVQGKVECGNFDMVELAPTVQCLTGNYRETEEGKLPFLEYILNAHPSQIRYDALQSEEGGRFYREQNRNLMVEAEENAFEELPPNYIWMTLNQIKTFLTFNNYFNIQARSLISAIRFV